MKSTLAIVLLAVVVPNLIFGASEEVSPKQSAEEMLRVEGSYEYNLAGKRLTRAIDPILLKRLSEHPEEDAKADYILAEWILKAGVKQRKEFQYLLEIEALRKIPRYESALLAYDYNVNGNQRALDELLSRLRDEVKRKDGWGAGNWAGLGSLGALSGINEWKLTKQILGSINLSADGSGGDERYGFWLSRRYYFPADEEFPMDYAEFCREIDDLQSRADHHSAPAASVDGRFLNIAILDLPPRFIAGIPTDNRVNLLRDLSHHTNDRRLDYSKGYLRYASDNAEENTAIEANCRFHMKLLPNTYSDNPKVLVIMVRNLDENENPSAEDTVVLDRDRWHGKWVDITDSVLPTGIERNRFFEPFGDFLSFHVKARKLYTTAPGRPRSYWPGALEADIRWDALTQKFVKIPPTEQVGAGQPATAPESKPEGKKNTKPESAVRPQ